MSKWYAKDGNDNDVVVQSKIRLARNLSKTPFPCKMSNELRKSTCKKIFAAIQNSKLAGEFNLIELQNLNEYEKIALYEKGLISARFAKQEQYGAVLVSKDEDVSIMLCEEDHIRITARAIGAQLKDIYTKVDEIDNALIGNLNIAFSDNYGFLTSNPMHLGTGLKASVVLNLPAVRGRNMMTSLSSMVSKLGFSIKSLYGGKGDMYELSNEISLGITEENALDNLNAICQQIIKQERILRDELTRRDDFDDQLYRAVGTLKMARKISTSELFSLLSLARIGIAGSSFGDNEKVNYSLINQLLFTLGTATIMENAGEQLTIDEVDKLRANYIRGKLEQS
jgi:protein arginine kinase